MRLIAIRAEGKIVFRILDDLWLLGYTITDTAAPLALMHVQYSTQLIPVSVNLGVSGNFRTSNYPPVH